MEEKEEILIRHDILNENNLEEAILLMNQFVEETEEILAETDHERKKERRKKLKEKKVRLKELLEALKKLRFHSEVKKRKVKSDLEKLLKHVERDLANSGFYRQVLDSSMESRNNTMHSGNNLQFKVNTSEPFLKVPELGNAFLEESMRDPIKASRHMSICSSNNFSRIEGAEREEDIQQVMDTGELIDRFATLHLNIEEAPVVILNFADKEVPKEAPIETKVKTKAIRNHRAEKPFNSIIEEEAGDLGPNESSSHYSLNSFPCKGRENKEQSPQKKMPLFKFCCN